MANEVTQNPSEGQEKIQQVVIENKCVGLREMKDSEQLQKRLNIQAGSIGQNQIPLFKSLGFYSGSDPDPLYDKGENIKNKFQRMFPDIGPIGSYINHNDMCGTMFTISRYFASDDSYLFISDKGYWFLVGKDDFDKKGIMAKSLCIIKSPKLPTGGIYIFNDSGQVQYYLDGVLEGILQGSCYTFISNSQSECEIVLGNKSYIYKSILTKEKDALTKNDIITHKDGDGINLGLGEIKELASDPKSNFLFVISEDESGNTNLHILDRKKLFNYEDPIIHEIKTISGVSDILVINSGDIILSKSDGSIDILNTNLNTLDDIEGGSFELQRIRVKQAQNITKKDVLAALGGFTLSLDTEEISNEGDEQDKEIVKQIWEKPIDGIGKTFKELFDEANSEDDISLVQKVFDKIKNRFPQITDMLKKIEKQIIDKKNTIILDSIFSELGDISTELGNFQDLPTLITIKTKLMGIQKKRRNVQAGIVAQDKDLKQLLETVNQKISECKEENKDEIQARIDGNLDKIQDILNNIDYSVNISSIYKDEIYQETEDLISYLSIALQEKYKKALRNLVNNRRNEIKKEIEAEKEKESKVIEDKRVEVEEYIEEIKEVLDDIDDISTVEQYKENDVLVEKIKKLLEELPSSIAQTLDLKLDRVFSERIYKLRLNGEETKGVVKNLDSYGIDTILYYDEDGSEQVEWKIEGKEKSDGKITLVVKLMNGETHEYDKPLYLKDFEKYGSIPVIFKDKDGNKRGGIKFDMTEEEFFAYSALISKWKNGGYADKYHELLKRLRELPVTGNNELEGEKKEIKEKIENLRKNFGDAIYTEHLINKLIKHQKLNPRSKVPPFDPNYIVLDEERDALKVLSARLVDQRQNGGMEILAGGPGLGKTVMCNFLASVTNRELIIVQCSKMDPNDLFFSPTLKKGETSREPAEWIKYVQKPGTIILFDEVDKLSDDCFAKLHELFDGRRTVSDPHVGTIKANPDCLFLGTMNCYGKLTNPINNRGRILKIEYPGKSNEAYKISKYTNNQILKKMSFEEFQLLYDKYITRGEPSPRNAQEKRIYDLIINIERLLNVFTELRKTYDSDEPFVYELSYRDARQIFVDLFIDYNGTGDFKKAMEKILKPKAEASVIDSDEKREQEKIVARAISKVMG